MGGILFMGDEKASFDGKIKFFAKHSSSLRTTIKPIKNGKNSFNYGARATRKQKFSLPLMIMNEMRRRR
jgi:hypothetical protein